jgi:hypothetical protein
VYYHKPRVYFIVLESSCFPEISLPRNYLSYTILSKNYTILSKKDAVFHVLKLEASYHNSTDTYIIIVFVVVIAVIMV